MTTQLVSAYTDLEKNQKAFEGERNLETFTIGSITTSGPEGLEVDFYGDNVPVDAQFYIEWNPTVVAIWEEENNGEDGNSEDGSEVGAGGEANPQEPDPELGHPGAGNAGEQPAEA